MRLRATRSTSVSQGAGGRGGIAFNWLNTVAGNWSDVSKWDQGALYPNLAKDTASIDGTGVPFDVTLDVDVKVNSLQLNSDTVLGLLGSTKTLTLAETTPAAFIGFGGGGVFTIGCKIDTSIFSDFQVGDAATISGVILGTGGFSKSGSAALTLSGVNELDGPVSILVGQLIGGAANAFHEHMDVTVANTSGVSLAIGAFLQDLGSIAGGGATGGGLVLSTSGTLNLKQSINTTFSGALSSAGTLNKSLAGILTLAGVNTCSGVIDLQGGELRCNSNTWLGTATLNIRAGSTISATGGARTNANVNAINIYGNFNFSYATGDNYSHGNGVTTLFADTVITFLANDSLTFNGLVAESGGSRTLTKAGNNGILSLNSSIAGPFTGDVFCLAGALHLVTNGCIGATATAYVGATSGSDPATLNLGTGFTKAIVVRSGSSGLKTIGRTGGIPTISGPVTLQTDVTIAASGNFIFSGAWSGTGDVYCTGTSAITFSAASKNWVGRLLNNAGSGNRIISFGLGSNVTDIVQSGGTGYMQINSVCSNTGSATVSTGIFGGTSTMPGAVTINSGGTLQGGIGDTSAGVFGCGGNIVLNTGAILRVGIGSLTTVSKAGTSGTLTLNNNVVNFPAAALNAGTYTLLDHAGARTGSLVMGTLPTGRTFVQFIYNANNVQVQLS